MNQETTHADRETHEPTPPGATVPQAADQVTGRDLLLEQLGRMAESDVARRLAGLLQANARVYDLVFTPWIDSGVRDEEGMPVEFEDPWVVVTLTVRNKHRGQESGHVTVRAHEVPILAAAIREEIDRRISEQIRSMNIEVARHMGIVDSLRTQCSKLQALRPARPGP